MSSIYIFVEVLRLELMLLVGMNYLLVGLELIWFIFFLGFIFDDIKNVYWLKMSWEIVWVLVVFRLCFFDFFVNKNKEVSGVV